MSSELEKRIQAAFGKLKADTPGAKAYLQLAAINRDG
jgi:hypothetical protein